MKISKKLSLVLAIVKKKATLKISRKSGPALAIVQNGSAPNPENSLATMPNVSSLAPAIVQNGSAPNPVNSLATMPNASSQATLVAAPPVTSTVPTLAAAPPVTSTVPTLAAAPVTSTGSTLAPTPEATQVETVPTLAAAPPVTSTVPTLAPAPQAAQVETVIPALPRARRAASKDVLPDERHTVSRSTWRKRNRVESSMSLTPSQKQKLGKRKGKKKTRYGRHDV